MGMNKQSVLIIALVTAMGCLFFAGAILAGTEASEVITMKADYPHKKGIVDFSHKKHSADYGGKCGDCHHDKDNKPLDNLKGGDPVQKCIECHSKPGEAPKGKDAPKLSKKQKREYHANAVHDNCKGCHRAFNKKNKTKKAPTTCTKCHPKTKK